MLSVLKLVLDEELQRREQEQKNYFIFQPRPYQAELMNIFGKETNYLIICWARRMGKDLLAFSLACRDCLDKPNTTVYYIFPTMKQAKMMLLEGITKERKSIIETVINVESLDRPKISDKLYHSDNTLRFKNGSTIYFIGSDNANTKVGGNVDILIFSEMALIKNKDIYQYLIPSVIQVKGKIIMVSTPRFASYFNELLEQTQSIWRKDILKATDERAVDVENKPIYTVEQLETARSLMSKSKFEQEYLCNINVANETAVYSQSLEKALWVEEHGNGRFYVSLDLGINDSTAIVFSRNDVIEHWYHNVGYHTTHYIDYIKRYCANCGVVNPKDITIVLPHDANKREDAITHLVSRTKAYLDAEFDVVVLPPQSVYKTIELTCFAIEKQKIKFLENYTVRDMVRLMKQYEYKSTEERTPIHGKGLSASNTCDAVEYLCLARFNHAYTEQLKDFEMVYTD